MPYEALANRPPLVLLQKKRRTMAQARRVRGHCLLSACKAMRDFASFEAARVNL
jgi:hypothetical protein